MSNGLVANFLIFVAADWNPSEKKLRVGNASRKKTTYFSRTLERSFRSESIWVIDCYSPKWSTLEWIKLRWCGGGGAEVSVSGAEIHGQRSIYSKRCPIPIRDRPPARLRIVPLTVAVRSMWPWLLNTEEEHFQEIWAEIRSTVQ